MSWFANAQYLNQIDYILCSQIFYILCGEGLYRQQKKKKKTLGSNCGSYHELLIAKFRLKLKNIEKP